MAIEPTFTRQLITLKQQSPDLAHLLCFLLSSAARVSEAIKISDHDITWNGLVRLKASKNSDNRIVSAGMATDFLLECKRKQRSPWQHFSRHFIYRQFKKAGVCIKPKHSSKNAITHAPRHVALNDANRLTNDLTEVSRLAGHKSTNSTKHYVND